MPKPSYILPDANATPTTNVKLYIRQWRALGKVVANLLGPEWKLSSFDPCLRLSHRHPSAPNLEVDLRLARAIAARAATPAITLTKDDWIEIDNALGSKAAMLRRGDYGPCMQHTRRPCPCDKKWAAHLKAIAHTIGPDGTIAATRGVAPLVADNRSTTTGRGKR